MKVICKGSTLTPSGVNEVELNMVLSNPQKKHIFESVVREMTKEQLFDALLNNCDKSDVNKLKSAIGDYTMEVVI